MEWRRAAMLEAEALVYRQDRAGLRMAAEFAADTGRSFEERRYYVRVLRIAIERQCLSRGVDTGTRYCLHEQWRNRRGSMIP